METVSVTDPQAVEKAAAVLAQGGVIIYPTDTLYGLGADALSDAAVSKVREIKGRDADKPIHAVVPDVETVLEYAEINAAAEQLARTFLPGPLTLILKKKEGIDSGIAKGIATFGIRIPNNRFCLELAKKFGKPFTTTSANAAGQEPCRSVAAILKQLGEKAALVDLVIDAGEMLERLPSTVLDVSSGEVKILREGAISVSDIST